MVPQGPVRLQTCFRQTQISECSGLQQNKRVDVNPRDQSVSGGVRSVIGEGIPKKRSMIGHDDHREVSRIRYPVEYEEGDLG